MNKKCICLQSEKHKLKSLFKFSDVRRRTLLMRLLGVFCVLSYNPSLIPYTITMENNANTLANSNVTKEEKLDILNNLLGTTNYIQQPDGGCGGIVAYSDTTYVRG